MGKLRRFREDKALQLNKLFLAAAIVRVEIYLIDMTLESPVIRDGAKPE